MLQVMTKHYVLYYISTYILEILFNFEKHDRYFCIQIDKPIFTLNHMKFFMVNFRLNLVKKMTEH